MDERRRDPADLARFTASAAALVAMMLFIRFRPDSLYDLSVEILRLTAVLPDTVQIAIVGAAQVLALTAAVGLFLAAVPWRRWSLLVPTTVAVIAAAGVSALTTDRVSRTLPSTTLHLPRPSWIIGESFPSSSYLAAITAAVVTLSPTWSRKWRRAAWAGVALVALSRLLTAATAPVGIVSAVLLGMTAGSAALFVFGINRLRPDPERIGEVLRQLGIPATEVRPIRTTTNGTNRYAITLDEGGQTIPDHHLEVVLVDSNDRDADLLARVIRRLRVRGDGDDQSGLSVDRIADHTALVTLLAQSTGARVTDVIALGDLDPGTKLLVLAVPDGQRLGDIDADEVDDSSIISAWHHLLRLHDRRVAHGRATRDNVIIAADGDAFWSNFRYGSVSATDTKLSLDIAEFLISTALLVGEERAVEVAVTAVPDTALVDALPLLQPIALSRSTRGEIGRKDDLVDRTRDLLAQRIDADSIELAPLQRITPARLGIVALITIATYIALSFGSDISKLGDALGQFSIAYLPALVILAAFTYPLLAISTMGAAPIRIPFGQMSLVALAQSLLNKFTPANAGGMALRVRYLQRLGMDVEPAATTLGLTSAFSGIAQMIVLAMFAIWAGSSGDLNLSLPTSMIAPVIVVISVAAGLFYLTPWGRRIWSSKLRPSLDRAWPVVRDLLRSPAKLTVLLTSNVADKLTTIAAFIVSLNAIGVHSSVAQLGFLYMTANTVAGAAPTPGGIGAIEAALTAALTATGVPTAEALSGVLVFRLATFWVPIPLGGIALARVRRQGLV